MNLEILKLDLIDNHMSDKLTLLIVFCSFVFMIYFARNKFKNWKNLNNLERSYILRAPLLCIVGIIILIIKIISEW